MRGEADVEVAAAHLPLRPADGNVVRLVEAVDRIGLVPVDLMHDVFAGDILTDFPFIEASFGLSFAGVAL